MILDMQPEDLAQDREQDRFEAVFVIDAPPAALWQRLVDAQPAETDEGKWWLPGFEATCREMERTDAHLLRVEKLEEPCAGTEIAVVLEATGSGTRVAVVQSGFGTRWRLRDLLAVGWASIVADLALFLERGVHGSRHLRRWSAAGWFVRETPGGPQVTSVQPDSPAAALGIAAGDVIVAVGSAPVVTAAELEAVMRVAAHLSEGARRPLEIEWVTGNERRCAELTP